MGVSGRHGDWGHAKEYVEAMWKMLQQPEPNDYVIGTGETHTVREFVEIACVTAGLDVDKYVRIDPELYRPAEVNLLLADPSKARKQLAWHHRTSFPDLVREMVFADCHALGIQLKRDLALVTPHA